MANVVNPSTPFLKWKMAIVTKSIDDWTLWNCDEKYERTLFIGVHDDLEVPYAALYVIYKGKAQPAAGNAIIADLASMQASINTALQELQSLIDQVNTTSASMQELWQNVNAIAVELEEKLEAMQAQIDKARAWAEGTDAEVVPLGGTHSAKTWAGIAKQAADQATGGSFPELHDGDQGKALLVNSTADGYVVQSIITETDTTKDYTWTGTNEYTQELWAQGGISVAGGGFNATSATHSLVAENYAYPEENSMHKYEVVNVKNLKTEVTSALATVEPANTGVNLMPAASTWDFWTENSPGTTTLNKGTGIVSGCSSSAYTKSAKTLAELGVPTDTKDAEIIMRFKHYDAQGATSLLRFMDKPNDQYAHNITYAYNGIIGIAGMDNWGYGGSSSSYPYNGPIAVNTWGYIKIKFANGVPTVSYLADESGAYSVDALPDAGWTDMPRNGGVIEYAGIPTTVMAIGREYTGGTGVLEIDLRNTKLTFGGITVWDGSTVAADPFADAVTPVGSVLLNGTTGIASGFDANSYLQFVSGSPSGNDIYDMTFRVMQDGTSGRGAILSFSDGPWELGLQDTQPYGAFQSNTTALPVTPTPAANVWNWVRFVRGPDSTGDFKTIAYVLPDPDNTYTLDTLPDLAEWHESSTSATVIYTAGRTIYLGRSTADSQYYFKGSIDMFNTRVSMGGVLLYDGAARVPKEYETQGMHNQSAGRIANNVMVRRFEANGITYMELDGMFEGTVAADSTITIRTKDYGFKGVLISVQAMALGTGSVTVNYNTTTAADMAKGIITLRTSLGSSEAYKVSVHCVIEQQG